MHTTSTYHIYPTTTLTADLQQKSIFVSHFANNMVYTALDTITQFAHNSLPKSRLKLSVTQQFMTTTLFDKRRIAPLMARPFEVINVTIGDTGSTTDVTKPPDESNG